MYVITFYSFKGGVGRTHALVNVGAQLLKQGRTVLLVDFDLEAPGLDAFPLLKPSTDAPGIVEFVSDYLRTGRAPIADEYAFSCPSLTADRKALWIMPSGIRNFSYSARLQAIDWQKLYSEHDGYLLFEDLKAQWESQLKPDYVLIDSRTGHTDVGGICTRQLPDAVALCFLPNEENISGLETVVRDIRQEDAGPLQKRIDVFMVPTNIPNLDDEQEILARRMREAKRRLEFDEPASVIHRYDSLSLLDNAIFVHERSHSRLAEEYRRLAQRITRKNQKDRDVALRILTGGDVAAFPDEGDLWSLDSRLNEIRSLHSSDGEVMHALALVTRRLGREEEAKALLKEADDLGFRSAETIIDSANEAHIEGQRGRSLTLLREAISHPTATYFDLNRAIRLILQLDVSCLAWLKESPAMRALRPSDQASLCEEMLASRATLPVAEEVLRGLVAFRSSPGLIDREFRTSLMLCLIGQRKFEEAMLVVGPSRPDPATLSMVDAFNYAMAEWGATKTAPTDLFERVTELSTDATLQRLSKNVCQCLAMAYWAIGKEDLADRSLRRALESGREDPSHAFSGWRYLLVSPAHFNEDLAAIRKMIDGENILPAVFMPDDDAPTILDSERLGRVADHPVE